MSNMSIWEQLRQPPKSALKEIKAGRLSGKTDINPQWRMQAMTEVFGPCGIGWKYTIDRLWTEPGAEGQVCAFALVSVYTLDADRMDYNGIMGVWSQPIQGIGGSMLIAKEKSGLYTSDEAYKMAVTDALSVALKALGVAADVYLGNYDGSKYRTPAPAESPHSAIKEDGEQKQDLPSAVADAPLPPSPSPKIKRFFAILNDLGIDEQGKEIVKKHICRCCDVDSTKLLSDKQIDAACRWAEKFALPEDMLNYIIEQGRE